MTSKRTAVVERATKETQIRISLDIDGSGNYSGSIGIPFFEHMLNLFTRHGLVDLEIEARGDLEVDGHHTVEDVGICLGQAFRQAIGDKKGIRRYGSAFIPMEETLAHVSLISATAPF